MKQLQEGSMQSKESESFGATETGALFPRLHVKETKVSGLRAPPRNKMALFEQFTIPPHRFVPPPAQLPSPNCPGVAAFYVPQGSSYDGRYMCNPCYQTIPYTSQHQMARQSIVTQPKVPSSSSSSVVSSCDKGKHESISGSSAVRTRACSSAVTSKALSFDKDGNQSASKTAKDQAQARSQKKDFYRAPLSQSGAGSDFLQCRTSTNPQDSQLNADCLQSSVGPSHRGKASSPCTMRVEAEKASLGVSSMLADAGVEKLKNRSPHMPDDKKVQSDRSLMFSAKRNVGSALESSSEVRVSIGLPVESGPRKCQTTVNLIDPPEENHCTVNDKEHRAIKTLADSNGLENDRSPNRKVEVNVSFSYFSVKASERTSNADVSRIKEIANVSLSNQLENKSCGSHMKPASNRSGEESEPSEPNDCSSPDQDSDSIIRSSNLMPKLIPKDVIGVIGQRDFWKARKAIILQQKTFSGQVFELHRLIKVQQLIASMPGLLIEEDSALVNANIYETAAAVVSENLGGNASSHLEGKISMKDKPVKKQLPQNSRKDQISYARDTNAHFQQCSEQHQRSGPVVAPYTQIFQGMLGTWGYPVVSPTEIHRQRVVSEKPGSFVYDAYLGAFSDSQVLNYGMVKNSGGIGTAPATLLSPVVQGIPADKLWQTDSCWIGPDQPTNLAVLSEEFSVNKDVSHSSAAKPGSAASQSGGLPQSDWPRPVLRKSSLPSKENPSIKKYQWLDNSPGEKQPPEIKKQRFQRGECTQGALGSEKMGVDGFSKTCISQSDYRVLSEIDAQQNGLRHHNSVGTSTILTRDFGSLKMGLVGEADAVFQHDGNFRVTGSSALPLFPFAPIFCPGKGSDQPLESDNLNVSKVIKAIPRSAVAASESTAIILKSIQQERWQQG